MDRGTEAVVDILQKARRNVSKRIEKVLNPDEIWKRVPDGFYRVRRKKSNRLQPLAQQPHEPVVLRNCAPVSIPGIDDLREASFTLHRLLRSSSRSEVYEASLPDEDEGLVALQILPCSFENIKRTSRALEIMRSTSTPGVIRYDAIYAYGGFLLFVLPWTIRLSDIVSIAASHSPSTADGLFREEFLVLLAFELLVSLRDVHRSGYVHGSLRASSILVDDESNIYVDGLLDAVPAESSRIHAYAGDMGSFISPEQLACSAAVTSVFQERKPGLARLAELGYGTNADVWSLGILIYELASEEGRSVYGDCTDIEKLIDNVVDMQFDTVGRCDDTRRPYSCELDNFVKRCLNRNFATRPSIAELLDDPLFERFKSDAASLEDANALAMPIDDLDKVGSIRYGPLCRTMMRVRDSIPQPEHVQRGKKFWMSKAKFNKKMLKKNHRCVCIKIREGATSVATKSKVKMTTYQLRKDAALSASDRGIDARLRQAFEMRLLDADKLFILLPALTHIFRQQRDAMSGQEEDSAGRQNPVTFVVPFPDAQSHSPNNPETVYVCAIVEIWD